MCKLRAPRPTGTSENLGMYASRRQKVYHIDTCISDDRSFASFHAASYGNIGAIHKTMIFPSAIFYALLLISQSKHQKKKDYRFFMNGIPTLPSVRTAQTLSEYYVQVQSNSNWQLWRRIDGRLDFAVSCLSERNHFKTLLEMKVVRKRPGHKLKSIN